MINPKTAAVAFCCLLLVAVGEVVAAGIGGGGGGGRCVRSLSSASRRGTSEAGGNGERGGFSQCPPWCPSSDCLLLVQLSTAVRPPGQTVH
jgi:hypothetical protein